VERLLIFLWIMCKFYPSEDLMQYFPTDKAPLYTCAPCNNPMCASKISTLKTTLLNLFNKLRLSFCKQCVSISYISLISVGVSPVPWQGSPVPPSGGATIRRGPTTNIVLVS